MRRWRLIRSGPLAGFLNMALDEALLEAVGEGRSEPVFRLYRWSPPALSLGCFQPTRDVDLAACRELGIDLVRRPTGGRAVLHDREATYAVIAPAGDLFGSGVLTTGRRIALALRRALGALGLPAELEGRRRGTPGLAPANCFVAPAVSELVYQGCKVAGSAQKRAGGAFLQHGSIPVEMDLERLCRLLDPDRRMPPGEGARRLAAKVGWLNRWLDPPATVTMVEEALAAGFAVELGLELLPDEPTVAEWTRARHLAAAKYGNEKWTMDPELKR